MLYFIDYTKQIVYIMPPKCGSTTISNHLKVDILIEYEDKGEFANDAFQKIIFYREDLVDRFLSGFYEDLINNDCYDTIHLSFHDYLLFLYDCFCKKTLYVKTFPTGEPLWFGIINNVYLPITDENGRLCSHIQSQKRAIEWVINKIRGTNVVVKELNQLSDTIGVSKKYNEKPKQEYDYLLSDLPLSHIKKNNIIMTKKGLTPEEIDIITKMYKEDELFIQELKTKFN